MGEKDLVEVQPGVFVTDGGRKRKTGPGGPGLDAGFRLGLALSGGGHRASLFGLGVLMAMRDVGKSPTQIASVSGGTITNAYLAQNYFAKATGVEAEDEERWEAATGALFSSITTKGAVSDVWVRMMALFVAVPPISLALWAKFGELPWSVGLPMLGVWATLLPLRGLLIEFMLGLRYAGGKPTPTLAGLMNPDPAHRVENVFCCTDLVTGRPLYFSSREGGGICRRIEDRPDGLAARTTLANRDREATVRRGVRYAAPRLATAAAIRASAGFPGIPPRLLRLRRLERIERESNDDNVDVRARVPPIAFLSDGGLWNNLATQPFDDGFLWGDDGPWVIIVADASAPPAYAKPWPLYIPLFAEVVALARQANILNVNTVSPRRSAHHDTVRGELQLSRSTRFVRERLYPVVSITDTLESIVMRIGDAVLRESESNFLFVKGEARRHNEHRWTSLDRAIDLEPKVDPDPSADVPARTAEGPSVYRPIDPNAAATYRQLKDLKKWKAHAGSDPDADPIASYRTTLSRISHGKALAIVARGYANTAVTLYLTRLTDKLVYPVGWLGRALSQRSAAPTSGTNR